MKTVETNEAKRDNCKTTTAKRLEGESQEHRLTRSYSNNYRYCLGASHIQNHLAY